MLVIYSSGFRSKNVKLVDIAVAGHKMTDDSLSEDLVFFAFFCIIFLMHFLLLFVSHLQLFYSLCAEL